MKKILFTITTATLLLFASCNKPSGNVIKDNDNAVTEQTASTSAKDGGEGFEAVASELGYITKTGKDYTSPATVKGGVYRESISYFPGTLRPFGPATSASTVQKITDLSYRSDLLYYNFETNEWERGIADFWKFENDGKRLTLRINPNIKFSDGSPLTVDDIIATTELLKSEDLGDPYVSSQFNLFEFTKISEHILQIDTQEVGWFIWHRLSMLRIFPKAYLDKVSPKEYISKYTGEFMPGLGPYTYSVKDSVNLELLTFERNPNWWGNMYPEFKNTYNFDKVQIKVIMDPIINKEAFKKGEIDTMYNTKDGSWWYMDDLSKQKDEFAPLKQNLMVKKVLFNGALKTRHVIYFNLRKPPFDNIKLRQAMSFAFNKDEIIDKIYHNDVVKAYSMQPLSEWESPNLNRYPMDLEKSNALLDEIGYDQRAEDGTRKNAEGKRLEFDMYFPDDVLSTKFHSVFQQNMLGIGIKINLHKSDWVQVIKLSDDFTFDVLYMSNTWTDIPKIDAKFLSRYADVMGSSNASGYKDPETDKLIGQMYTEFDPKKRFEIAHQVDERIGNSFESIAMWTAPYTRKFGAWNRFVMTPGDYHDCDPIKYWYLNKEKDEKVAKGKTDTSITLEEGDVIIDPFGLKPAEYTVSQY